MLIHQNAHELGNRKNRVGVIELDGVELRKTAQVRTVLSNVVVNNGLQRRRAEEVLLANTQNLTFKGRVVRVKNTRDIHGALAVDNRIGKALRVERVVVELFHGLGLPQTQSIDVLGAVTGNRHVIGDRANGQIRVANNALFLFATNNEGVALFHPRIRVLGLETIVEELLEQSVAVQDAITGNGQVQGRARIKEARCQTTKTTITQSGIGFFFQNHGQVLAQCSQGLAGLVNHAKVGEVIEQRTSHKELCGEVVFHTAHCVGALSCMPAVSNTINDCRRKALPRFHLGRDALRASGHCAYLGLQLFL